MPRPPLPIGTWGEISTRTTKTNKNGKPLKHLAHAKFRDHDGKVRAVTATGTTKTAARTALLTKLQNRAKTNHSAELTMHHKVNHLLDLWEKRFEQRVVDGQRSPTSLDNYRRALKNHVRPAIGELHIAEATTPRLDTVLANIRNHAGPATAKTCRAVISGAMKIRRPLRRHHRQPRPRSRRHRSQAQAPTPCPHDRRSHPPAQKPDHGRTRHRG